jgi:Na+-translocating ferredoxin:NAD+ oxidoreductase RnfG subunit
MEKFTIGLMIGAIGGALLTANNYKMRALVKKSQKQVQDRLDELMDDKLKDMEMDEQTEEEKTPAKKSPFKKATAK